MLNLFYLAEDALERSDSLLERWVVVELKVVQRK